MVSYFLLFMMLNFITFSHILTITIILIPPTVSVGALLCLLVLLLFLFLMSQPYHKKHMAKVVYICMLGELIKFVRGATDELDYPIGGTIISA